MYKRAEKTITLQHGQSDCGVACLASVIRYHGGIQTLERIKELSGSGIQGVSLLGLFQAAGRLGFDAEGLKAESVENLRQVANPVILHVEVEDFLDHFVVFYGFTPGKAIIGDPAKGVVTYSIEELNKIWKSKSLLNLVPNPHFVKREKLKSEKRQWIVALIKDDFHFLMLALMLGVVISVLGLSSAIFSQKLIDEILPANDTHKLFIGLSLLLLILLIRAAIGYLRGLFVIRQSKDFNERIIEQFYHRLLRLPKQFFDTRKIGELIARMNDTRRIQTVITFIAGDMVIDSLVLILSCLFLFIYSAAIGSVLILSTVMFGLLIRTFHKRIIISQNEVMQSYAMSESHYVDAIQGISTIKVNNKEHFFDGLNKRFYSNFQRKIFELGILHNRFNVWSEILATAFIITIFALTSSMVLNTSLKPGELIAILSISSSLLPSLNRLALSNIQIQEAKIAFDRMYEFASIQAEDNSEEDWGVVTPAPIRLAIKNLSFRFPGQKLLLSNATLSLQSGEMIALLGESGSGKSTLTQILQKFYKPESGNVEINGTPLENIPTAAWRDLLGVVPQEVKIFNGSLLYNIAISENPDDITGVINFCAGFGFDKYFEKLPNGYLSVLGEEGISLSGGQKQLVAMARALYKKPRLLILDEATASMDKHTEAFIFELLSKLKNEMAVLLVTHKIKSARLADRIYVLQTGCVKELSSVDEDL